MVRRNEKLVNGGPLKNYYFATNRWVLSQLWCSNMWFYRNNDIYQGEEEEDEDDMDDDEPAYSEWNQF